MGSLGEHRSNPGVGGPCDTDARCLYIVGGPCCILEFMDNTGYGRSTDQLCTLDDSSDAELVGECCTVRVRQLSGTGRHPTDTA